MLISHNTKQGWSQILFQLLLLYCFVSQRIFVIAKLLLNTVLEILFTRTEVFFI